MPNDQIPYPFQTTGAKWLMTPRDNGYGFSRTSCVGLLGDEMGLGKTAQALMAVQPMIKAGKRLLFIVPGATITQWQRQYQRWILDCEGDEFGMDGLFALRATKDRIPYGMSCIISHAMIARHDMIEKLVKANFDGIIIDEVHKFGNRTARRTKNLFNLRNLTPTRFEDCRILLSGTPVRNYASEMFPIVHMLDPFKFRDHRSFANKYLDHTGRTLCNPAQFHADIAPYYLRRTTAEVLTMLPTIRRTKLYTPITDPLLSKAYNHTLDVMTNLTKNGRTLDSMSLLGYLQKLRHITGIAKACEPAILEPIRDYLQEGGPDGTPAKVLIGLHHHLVADRLRKAFKEFRIFAIQGGLNDQEKERIKQEFITCDAPALCLLSIKAAGEGIDGLQLVCCKSYVFERQWNGADELQFEKRLHRPGQKLPVDIEYTLGVATVDEFFDSLVEYKRHITTQVEDENYESNPAFIRELAERVMAAGHLPTSYQNVDELMEVA